MNLPIAALYLFPLAGFPQQGQVVLTQSVIFASGDSPVSVGSYESTIGSLKGSSLSGTGTYPQSSHLTIGIGSPQYLWRENTQSRSLKFTFWWPLPSLVSHSVIAF